MNDPSFWHINVGNLLTIASFLIGGMYFIFAIKGSVDVMSLRLSHVEASNDDQKEEIKKLAQVLVTLGKYEERFLRVEGMIDDLRHGRGLIK